MDFRIHRFDQLTSTQIEAKQGYEAGRYAHGDMIVAQTQTGAYGRRGRAWQAPQGNLYATWIQDFTDPAQLSWTGFAVGLALYDAVHPFVTQPEMLRLKWPNDLLLDGMKFTGLLLEVVDKALVIGVGMNIAVTPETDQPVTCLHAYAAQKPSVDAVLQEICRHYGHWHKAGCMQGFGAMREIWLNRAAFRGKTLAARLANGRILTGVFHDLDATGVLLLQTPDGIHRVTAADIYLHTENS